ncbi:hypothetical protein CEE37_07235 [candidate division LCP-89 bacterium B3_LCP]|uniref:ASPIC/UnbV domain-containing protein n=1 Tax=candidate division LCP-89 bacterium B3_LCP TaxID=2012998 RepID=A0A532V0L3_UNCL8|nr:MAG: hypothetical protein CEE37_07235 [candidate division LCP-89 bacterium B3_LCP]
MKSSAIKLTHLAVFFLLIISTFLFVSIQSGYAGGLFSIFKQSDPHEDFQQWLDEGREFRSRGMVDEAITSFNRLLEIDPIHDEATYEIAQTYFKARLWPEAMDWFYAVSLFDPQRREAYLKRWISIVELAKDDSLLGKSARVAVRDEMADFLKSYPWDWETLNTMRKSAQLIADSLLFDELADRIVHLYPDSPAGYEIISERFFDGIYPIWEESETKIAFINEFLKDYPISQFRETAWLYLTHSLNEVGDLPELRSTLNEWMAEDSDNPLPYERSVLFLFEMGVDADSLLPIARKAVEKCRGWRGKPVKHVEQRILEGKRLYANTRLNMARLLIELERFAEARLWLLDGSRNCGYGIDDDGTTASFDYYLGLIAEKEKDFQGAFDNFTSALIQGDTHNRWTHLADSAIVNLFDEHFDIAYPDLITMVRARNGYVGPQFKDVTSRYGLGDVRASRVAWGDANGDGFDDLLLGGKRLFINRLGNIFIEVSDSCGIAGNGIRGGVWADVDLDGDLDLYCAANGGKNGGDRLFLNDGNDRGNVPRFRDVTDIFSQIRDGSPTEGAAWGDLQGDGRPDLYVGNYETSSQELGKGTPDYLYLNIPDEDSLLGFSLQKLGPDSGIQPPFGENLCGRGVAWGDFDGDDHQDVYVSNYRLQENLLWSVNSDGVISNKARYYGIAGKEFEGWWGHTIGSEWADFDNDGDLDLFSSNLAHPRYIEFSHRSCLYENRLNKEEFFYDIRGDWGIKYEETHSDPAWGDVDGDGDLDLFITSIYPDRRSFLYLNDLEAETFKDVTYLAGVRITNGWGCAFSDFDNDGDLDLIVGSGEGVRLFRNDATNHHWIEVELDVPGSAYGTKVTVKCGKKQIYRELSGGKGTTSQHSNTLYFGLGSYDKPVNIEVRYPWGGRVKLKKVQPDQKVVVSGSAG